MRCQGLRHARVCNEIWLAHWGIFVHLGSSTVEVLPSLPLCTFKLVRHRKGEKHAAHRLSQIHPHQQLEERALSSLWIAITGLVMLRTLSSRDVRERAIVQNWAQKRTALSSADVRQHVAHTANARITSGAEEPSCAQHCLPVRDAIPAVIRNLDANLIDILLADQFIECLANVRWNLVGSGNHQCSNPDTLALPQHAQHPDALHHVPHAIRAHARNGFAIPMEVLSISALAIVNIFVPILSVFTPCTFQSSSSYP